jgi:hypothetical protein
LLCGRGILPQCVSHPLPFLHFIVHYHWFFLCMPPHLFIIDNIRPTNLKHFSKTPVYKYWQVMCICLVFTAFHILYPCGWTHLISLLKLFTFATVDISVAIHDWSIRLKAVLVLWTFSQFPYPTGIGHHPAEICKSVNFFYIGLLFNFLVTFFIDLSNFVLSQPICKLAKLSSLYKSPQRC